MKFRRIGAAILLIAFARRRCADEAVRSAAPKEFTEKLSQA